MGIKVTQLAFFTNITARYFINDFPNTHLVNQGGQVTFGCALPSWIYLSKCCIIDTHRHMRVGYTIAIYREKFWLIRNSFIFDWWIWQMAMHLSLEIRHFKNLTGLILAIQSKTSKFPLIKTLYHVVYSYMMEKSFKRNWYAEAKPKQSVNNNDILRV